LDCRSTAGGEGRDNHDRPESRIAVWEHHGRKNIEQAEHADGCENADRKRFEFRSRAASISNFGRSSINYDLFIHLL